MSDNRCVICDRVIPEGRMVCPDCERAMNGQDVIEKMEKEEGIVKQERFKSWALWMSIAALVVFCVREFAGLDIGDTVDGLMNVLLPVLVAFGIVNNPTSKDSL